MSDVELLFLGSGTSAGVPMIGCHCAVCTSPDPHDKRTRTSVVISYNSPAGGTPTRVLVDTTPELRLQAVRNGVDRIDAVVFTHGHADHVMGLDDVRRFNAIKGGPLDVWADEPTQDILLRSFGYAFREPEPEMKVFRPHLELRSITGPFDIGGVTWTPIPLMHGDMPVLGFRVGKLAYCTDVSFIPPTSYPLLEGLDVLVLDALQRKRHITHFSLEQAMDEAKKIRAKRTLFTHIAHGLGHAETNAELPADIRLAYDGLRVTARLS
jgi:phosphoribosyl 1,2-cyclic phosphate phosphodiesterase